MKQLIDLVRELLARLKTESPDVYKKLQWISGTLATLIGVALGLNSAFEWGWGEIVFFNIPLTYILGSVATFIGGIFATAITPVKDKEHLDAKLKK